MEALRAAVSWGMLRKLRKLPMRISHSNHPAQTFLTAFDVYADAVFRRCFSRVPDREAALELTEEAFRQTWNYIVDRHDIENTEDFLMTVADSCCLAYERTLADAPRRASASGFVMGARTREPRGR